jgi:hypothetical protein
MAGSRVRVETAGSAIILSYADLESGDGKGFILSNPSDPGKLFEMANNGVHVLILKARDSAFVARGKLKLYDERKPREKRFSIAL